MDLTLKMARIVDFCDKLSGFADFEKTADRVSAMNFALDSGLYLSVQIMDSRVGMLVFYPLYSII